MTGNKEHTLLFVDDEVNILHSLQRLFRREGYNILTASSGKEGLELIKANSIALIISDNRMPEMEGVEFLSKAKKLCPETIRFMLTGYSDMNAVTEAINSGEVYRYITKPWNDDGLKFAVKEALDRYDLKTQNRELLELTQKQNTELVDMNKNLEAKVLDKTKKIRDNFFSFIRVFADVTELYDPNIGGHSKRVAGLVKKLAITMKLDPVEVDLIESAALLHTIGLIGVPRYILDKNEKDLNKNELAVIRHSPILTQGLLSSIDFLRQVGILIKSHSERYDGKGYPDGLKQEEIHIGSRMIAVCKLYDTLTTKADGMLHKDLAIEVLRAQKGKSVDPEVVDTFIDLINHTKTEKTSILVPVKDIKRNMVLAENLETIGGRLLITKGSRLTNEIIMKIHSIHKIDPILEGVHIERES